MLETKAHQNTLAIHSTKIIRFFSILSLTTWIFFSGNAAAVNPSTNSVQANANAGAVVGNADSGDAFFSNPAAAAVQRKYTLNLGYGIEGKNMNASVIDMKSGRVGGGLSYQRQDLKNNSSKDPAFGGAKRLDQFFKLGLFTPASEKLYVGTNVKYTIRDFEDPALGKDKENWDFDLGALYIVNKDLSFGTVFKNVLQGDNVVEAQSIAVGGTYYFQTNISVSGQVEYLTDGQDLAVQPSERMSWSVAAAYNFLEEYGVSAGYRSHPSFEQELISAGLKFQSEKYGVQYAFQYDLDGESTTNHSLGASFYF